MRSLLVAILQILVGDRKNRIGLDLDVAHEALPAIAITDLGVVTAGLNTRDAQPLVVVDFLVDTNGDVQNAYAVKSSQREFEAAAVQAVSKWKFKPGKKGGRNVITHMQVPIVFTLNED